MKEKDISKEARELIPNDRHSAPKYWRFDDLTEIHCELLRLEKEFLDSVEDYEGGKYAVKYKNAHIVHQILMMADMSKRKYSIDGLPFGAWSVIEKLTCKFKLDNNMTMSEQWVSNVCDECGEVFDVEEKSQHSMYCSKKCKRSAEYKRKKAKIGVSTTALAIKDCEIALKKVDNILTLYSHFTNMENAKQSLMQSLEYLKEEHQKEF